MKSLRFNLIYIIIVSIFLLACGKKEVIEDQHSSRLSLDWSGFYQGVISYPDNEETYVDLEIKKDSTFIKREKMLKSDNKLMTIHGTFTWSEDGNSIILQSDFEAYNSILAIQENKAIFKHKLNTDLTKQEEGQYILTKIPGILLEREWIVTKLKDTKVAIVPEEGKDHLNIYFDSDENKVYGYGGCNFYRSSYYLVDHELSFTPVMSTKMAGPNINVENKFFKSLLQVKEYEILDNELFLKDANGINLITAKLKNK